METSPTAELFITPRCFSSNFCRRISLIFYCFVADRRDCALQLDFAIYFATHPMNILSVFSLIHVQDRIKVGSEVIQFFRWAFLRWNYANRSHDILPLNKTAHAAGTFSPMVIKDWLNLWRRKNWKCKLSNEKIKNVRYLNWISLIRFPIDSKNNGDEDEYIKDVILGCRQYCVNDPLSNLPTARLVYKMWVEIVKHFHKLIFFLSCNQPIRDSSDLQICFLVFRNQIFAESFRLLWTRSGIRRKLHQQGIIKLILNLKNIFKVGEKLLNWNIWYLLCTFLHLIRFRLF